MDDELTTKEIREMIKAGKSNDVPPDDLKIYFENIKRRNKYDVNEIGVRNMYAAICMQSIADFKMAMISRRRNPNSEETDELIQECKDFFKSDFFTDIVGEKSLGEIMSAARRIPDGGYNHYLKTTEKIVR